MIKDKIISVMLDKGTNFRCDGSPFFLYPEISSFGVITEPFSFQSRDNTLYGDIVYKDKKEARGVLIFLAGFGAGRKAYSTEISNFAKAGFIVFSFDGTGCMQSQGKNIKGLGQINVDIKNFFKYFKTLDSYKNFDIFVVGHSWGGYGALSTLNCDYNIKKVVSISGYFSNVDQYIKQAPALQKYKKELTRVLINKFGDESAIDCFETLRTTNIPTLYVSGTNDNVIDFSSHFNKLKNEIRNPNVHLIESKDRYHQPYWSVESQNYFLSISDAFNLNHSSNIKIDYSKLFCDDNDVLQEIINFLQE